MGTENGNAQKAQWYTKNHMENYQNIPSYNPNSKRCFLCVNEKYEIATYKGDNLLNKRTEIINTCRHRSKYKLANCDTID